MLYAIYSKSNIQNFLILLYFMCHLLLVKDAGNIFSKRCLDRTKSRFNDFRICCLPLS